MTAGLTRISTEQVESSIAVDFWQKVVGSSAAPVTLTPLRGQEFFGEIVGLASTDSVEMIWSCCGGQLSTRTAKHIAGADDEYIVAIVDISGTSPQPGTALIPGALTLFDTSRPARLVIERPRTMIVVRARRELVAQRCAQGNDLFGGPSIQVPPAAAQLVAGFLTSVAELAVTEPDHARVLVEHVPGLLGSAVDVAARRDRPAHESEADLRRRAKAFLRANYRNPDLTADEVARALLVSRRTLFRVVGPEGVSGTLRRLRTEHVRRLLKAYPDKTVTAIAAEAGFRDERSLYRTFRRAESMTPAEYRARVCRPTD